MKKIRLTEEAYYSGGSYEASAVDAEGNRYTVIWAIRDGYNPAVDEEDTACNWDNPSCIVQDGMDVTDCVTL